MDEGSFSLVFMKPLSKGDIDTGRMRVPQIYEEKAKQSLPFGDFFASLNQETQLIRPYGTPDGPVYINGLTKFGSWSSYVEMDTFRMLEKMDPNNAEGGGIKEFKIEIVRKGPSVPNPYCPGQDWVLLLERKLSHDVLTHGRLALYDGTVTKGIIDCDTGTFLTSSFVGALEDETVQLNFNTMKDRYCITGLGQFKWFQANKKAGNTGQRIMLWRHKEIDSHVKIIIAPDAATTSTSTTSSSSAAALQHFVAPSGPPPDSPPAADP